MSVLRWIAGAWSAWRNRPCTCHGCRPRPLNQSRSPHVSHGLHMWVRDGKIHWRAKSRIVDQ